MNLTKRSERSVEATLSGNSPAPRAEERGFRLRRLAVVVVLVLGPVIAACTPEEIEQAAGLLTVSFEEGGLEGGLSSALFVAEQAIPIIGMRLGGLAP